jgi:hypothetical protein
MLAGTDLFETGFEAPSLLQPPPLQLKKTKFGQDLEGAVVRLGLGHTSS